MILDELRRSFPWGRDLRNFSLFLFFNQIWDCYGKLFAKIQSNARIRLKNLLRTAYGLSNQRHVIWVDPAIDLPVFNLPP
jgi:hypothetical protein